MSSMRLIRHYHELPPDLRGGVVALGNFDGVHRGHQAVIHAARSIADGLGAPLVVMSFEPHPRAFFNPNQPPFRLTPFRVKARLIEALGADLLHMQHFDGEFASLSALEFVGDVLMEGLGVRHVVVGHDYVFGRGRLGNGALLHTLAAQGNFGFTQVPPAMETAGDIYSSTRIRTALTDGRPGDAARLLGHYWEIEGRVEHGDARGRTIGFPTANLTLGEYQRPATGVYAVRAGVDLGDATQWHDGVANYGRRPTFDKTDEILEVHLLGTSMDLYGKHLRVALVDHIRPERKFAGIGELTSAIAADAQAAKAVLSLRHFPESPGPMVPVGDD